MCGKVDFKQSFWQKNFSGAFSFNYINGLWNMQESLCFYTLWRTKDKENLESLSKHIFKIYWPFFLLEAGRETAEQHAEKEEEDEDCAPDCGLHWPCSLGSVLHWPFSLGCGLHWPCTLGCGLHWPCTLGCGLHWLPHSPQRGGVRTSQIRRR